jgi:hypothetical protein
MSKKLPYLEKRVSKTFSLKRRTIMLFDKRVEELGLDKQIVMEQIMVEWVKKMKKL